MSNTLVQLVAPVLRMLFGLGLTVILSRYLGLAGFGAYALVFGWVATFSGVFNEWGLGTICLREISQRAEARGRLIASAATLQAVIAAGSYVLMVIILVFLRYPASVRWAIALYGLSILLTPLDILALPFQAELRLRKLLGPSLLGVGMNFLLSMAVVALHGPLPALVGAALASLILQYAWVGFLSLKVLGSSIRPSVLGWSLLIREAWPLGAGTVVGTTLQQAPLLALSLFSLEGVGLFNAANKIPQQLLLLPLAVRGTSFPLLSAAWTMDRTRFIELLEKLIGGSLLISIPTAILGIALAQPLVHLLFGASFAGSAIPFALLITVFAIMFPGILLGEALTAAGFQALNLVILTGSLPLLLALLFILVPANGATGAALAVLSCYAAIVAATVCVACSRLGLALGRTLVPAAVASLLGAAVIGSSAVLSPVPVAGLGGLVAFTTLALLRPDMVRALWSLRPLMNQ